MKKLKNLFKYQALKHSSFSRVSLAAFILIFAAIGGYILLKSSAASYMTGASLGICSPSPCTAGTVPSWPSTNVVNMGTINNGTANETRYYAYYVPKNLVINDPAHPPAAVFFAAGGGGSNAGTTIVPDDFDNSKMQAEADINNFIVIILMPPQATVGNPSGRSGWLHPQTDCGGAGGVVGGGACGSSSSPSDEPYIKAAVAAATNRFNIDPDRRYVVGGSSGANMARDVACDASQIPSNSSLFRGFATLGGGANTKYKTTGPGVCPSGNRRIFYLQIMGKSTQQDPYITIDLASGDHTILGFDHTRAWWASYLGNCAAPVHRLVGSPLALNDIYDYTCANAASPQFEAVAVTNGGHTWCNLDEIQGLNCPAPSPATGSRNGWSTAAWMWNFFANTKTSMSGTSSPLPTMSFSSSPTTVNIGTPSNLIWSSSNANSCTASGAWSGAKPVAGSQAVYPSSTSAYTLTCTGAGGNATSNVTITVALSDKLGSFNSNVSQSTGNYLQKTNASNTAGSGGILSASGSTSTGLDQSEPRQANLKGSSTTVSSEKKAIIGTVVLVAMISVALGAAYCIRLYHQRQL